MYSKKTQVGHYYFYQQQFKEAIVAYRNDPKSPHYYLGTAYLAQGLSLLAKSPHGQVIAIQQEIAAHLENAIQLYHLKSSEKIPAEMSTIIEMADLASVMMKKPITPETQVWARKVLMQLDWMIFTKQYMAKHVKCYNDQVKERHPDVVALEQLIQCYYPSPAVPDLLNLKELMSLYELLVRQDTPRSDNESRLFQAIEKKLYNNFNDDSETLSTFTATIISSLIRISDIKIDTILDLRARLTSVHMRLVTSVKAYLDAAKIFDENTLRALMNIAENHAPDENLKFILNQFISATSQNIAQENLCHFYMALKKSSQQDSHEINQVNELAVELIHDLMDRSSVNVGSILFLYERLAPVHIPFVTAVKSYLIAAKIFDENTLRALMNIAENHVPDENLKLIYNQFISAASNEIARENLCLFYKELKKLSQPQDNLEISQMNDLKAELIRGLMHSSNIVVEDILRLDEQLKPIHVDVINLLLPYLLEGGVLDAECIVPLMNIAEQNVDCAESINFIARKFIPSLRNFLLKNREKIDGNFKEFYRNTLLRFFSLCLNEENANNFYKQISKHDFLIWSSAATFFSELELYLDIFLLIKKNTDHVDCNAKYQSIMNLFFEVRSEFTVDHRIQYDSLKRFVLAISQSDNLCRYYLGLFSLSQRFGKDNIDHLIRIIETESSWDALSYRASEFLFYDFLQKHPEKSLDLVKQEFGTYSQDVQYPLSESELNSVFDQYRIILDKGKKILLPDELNKTKKECLNELKNHPDNKDNHLLLLAIIRQEVMNVFKIFPYNTQIINVLALWNAPNHRCIAQIKTGEGKSCIVAMLATFLACQGYPVDVITTSPDLAKRDATKFERFYKKFGLTVRDNASHFENTYIYTADIVYGTNTDFEFAYLYELSQTKCTRNGRPLCAAIVDEADSMFIDMQGQSARITSNLADDVSDKVYQVIWDYLSSQKVTAVDLKHYLQEKFKNKLFDDDTIEDWYNSYQCAASLTLGKHYVIKAGDTELEQKDSNTRSVPGICIVDYKHTGQVQEGRRWNKGLHSFLEIKHHLKIKKDFLTSCCISHPSYFNQYAILFGLTGTVGMISDREELIKIYGVTTYDSPPYHPSQKKQEKTIVTQDRETQLQAIVNAMLLVVAEERPVLILCETINDSNQLYALCAAKVPTVQLYNGLQKSDVAENLIALAGNACMVTIATNTAGRGTDIIVSSQVAKKGGLHVIATFLMSNPRVEVQGFGRAARQGNPGSFQYIVALTDFKNVDTQNKTTDEVTAAWHAHREAMSQAYSIHHVWSSKYLILNYLLQKLFFTLHLQHCKQLKDDWVRCFNKMEHIFSSLYDSRSEPQKIAQYEQMLRDLIKNFWLVHGLKYKYPLATHCRKNFHNDALVSFLVDGEPLNQNILLSICLTQVRPTPDWREKYKLGDFTDAIDSIMSFHGLFRKELKPNGRTIGKALQHEISAADEAVFGERSICL